MLWVRIEGHEVETTPGALARLVFDGKVDRHSPVKPAPGAAERPLEQSLESPHQEALTSELHRRLRLLCSLDSSAVDMQELCTQVERLCQWRWPNPPIAARFFWTAAWLHELADRVKSALDFYDAFLLMPCHEGPLRLLALNNRGVLRIRLGRLDGVGDLAQAAIAECGGNEVSRVNPQSTGLPTACFNLLNLINISFGAADLLRAVDGELTHFFSRLPANWRAWWLPESDKGDDGLGISDGGFAEACDADPPSEICHPQCSVPSILRDPTYQRLNTLVTRLAVRARDLTTDREASAFRRLSLWDCRLDGDARVEGVRGSGVPVGPSQRGPGARDTAVADRLMEEQHRRCAEAASVLLADDIPSSLTKPEGPLARARRAAEEELAALEGHLTAGRYELAQARLQVQRKVLSALNGQGGTAALLARVEAQLEKIADLETQEEQLKVQQMCAGFAAEVDRFCTLGDLGQAQAMLEDLTRQLQQARARLAPPAAAEAIGLLDELAARCRQHVHELQRAQIAKTLAESLRHLRENRPAEATTPVPPSVYEALAQCRHQDPAGWIEDWAALEEQLDAHQGRYHAHKALSALRSDSVPWDQVEGDLTRALVGDPAAWLMIAPLFGLQADDAGRKESADVHPPAAIYNPQLALDRAARLLERVLGQIRDNAGKCLRLWQGVETTLLPLLAGTDVEAMTRAGILAERYLDHWPPGLPETPGRADPRHPVNRFLEACAKARRLVEAQRLLEARPPQLDQAREHLLEILRLGLDTRDQLQRAVTGLYLTQFHEEDPPSVQRQVLAGLEDWVRKVSQENLPHIREQEIVEETEKVRVAVL
jgi:hypothetical protein